MSDLPTDPLDVLLVTVREQYYIPKFLQGMLDADQIRIVGLTTVPPTLGTKSLPAFLWDFFTRFGPRVFAQHVWFYGKYRLLDTVNRTTGRGNPYSPRTLVKRHNIEYRHTDDVNADEYIEYADSLSPDVLVSVAATQRFESQLLDIPSKCAINIHSSLLPEYKGVSPSFWALLNDEAKTGITVHYMTEDLDAGAILRQEPLDIHNDDTLHTLNRRVAENGSKLLVAALEDIQTEAVSSTPMPDDGSYYSMPERDDVRQFVEQGNQFF